MNTNFVKIYKLPIIFGIIILAFIILVIFPFFSNLKEKSKEFSLKKAELVNQKIKKENLEEFQKLYQDYQPNLEKIDQLFIEPEAPVGFISFLEKVAEDSQVDLKIIPGETKREKGDPWPSTLFQLTSYSSFPNFLRLLEKLENSPYLIEITNLTLNRLTEREIEIGELKLLVGDVRGDFTIKVYTK